MTDRRRLAQVILLNRVIGLALVIIAVVGVALIALGSLPSDAGMFVRLGFAAVLGVVALATARAGQQDLNDPAGIEQRFERGAMVWSAVLLFAGLAAVIAIIAWGLFA